MPKNNNAERDRRISEEILVDAYGDEEVIMSWHVYLEDNLAFPFYAKCINKREISPLKKREVVEVLKMAPNEDCESEMFVIISWQGNRLGVPLSQIQPTEANAKTKQAVGDWQYWSEDY